MAMTGAVRGVAQSVDPALAGLAESASSRVPDCMWTRVIAKLVAVFGVYMIVLARMANQSGKSYTPGMLELAGVTVLFAIVTVFILAWRPRPRPKPSLDEPDE